MRKAIAAAAAVLAAIIPIPGRAEAPLVARASVDFRIVIPAFVRVKTLVNPQRLQVTMRDVERGYVDLDDASSLLLTSNSPAGYSVSVAFDPTVVSEVDVRMPSRSGVMIDAALHIGYRLHLKSGVAPGDYRWPVVLTFGAHSL